MLIFRGFITQAFISLCVLCAYGLTLSVATPAQAAAPKRKPVAATAANPLQAEARLLKIYQLIGQGQTRQALAAAESLATDHPNFALAQLVYGDLLNAQMRPLKTFGDIPEATLRAAPGVLTELREESLLRIRSLRERPPLGQIPLAFIKLSPRNKHAIAVDASRARLYLFENTESGLKLIGDYYASVGKLGLEKQVEGDLRTPLGIYYITNTLDPNSLKDLYGAGALPINYPNPYDLRRGKTGSGIWLHGVPKAQFARAPKATDGCVAIANPDLEHLMQTVEIRTTPVVIASHLQWAQPSQIQTDRMVFEEAFKLWRSAKSSGQIERVLQNYLPDFNSYGKTLRDWQAVLEKEMKPGKPSELKDIAMLYAPESAQHATMVVTYSEIPAGKTSGATKRQYWLRSAATQNQWKIFFEGIVG